MFVVFTLFILGSVLGAAAQDSQEELIDGCTDSFNKKHRIDDSYIGPDGCNTCRCAKVGNLCTRKFCEPKTKMTSEANKCVDSRGNLHKTGESYTHVDGCNTCVCKDFGGACTRKFCLKSTRGAVRSVCKDAAGNGREEGDVWTAADGCNTCRCGALGPLCTKIGCLDKDTKHDNGMNHKDSDEPMIVDETGDSPCTVNGVTKFPGDSWLTEDSCNICECTGLGGKVECTEESCRARFLRLVDPKQIVDDGNSGISNKISAVALISSLFSIMLLY